MVVVHAADIQDYDGLKLVFEAIRGRFGFYAGGRGATRQEGA